MKCGWEPPKVIVPLDLKNERTPEAKTCMKTYKTYNNHVSLTIMLREDALVAALLLSCC